ncbi:MAG: YdbL family protein [Limibacillus sp.]|jgi:uncharacterized protein
MTQLRFSRRAFAGLLTAAALTLSFGAPALADQLDDLRRSGAVGERYDGLLVARDPSATSFVNQVNAQRSGIYQDRAAKQGVSPADVGRVYAKQIFQKAPKGTYFQQENGSWVQK